MQDDAAPLVAFLFPCLLFPSPLTEIAAVWGLSTVCVSSLGVRTVHPFCVSQNGTGSRGKYRDVSLHVLAVLRTLFQT